MSIRVIQWATGTVGIHAVPAIVAHPQLELAGLWVHSDAKAGRDAGELCGGSPVGVIATQDTEALLATDAEVVCYTANSDVRPGGVVDDICRMLETGLNVVNTSFVPLLYPKAAGEGVYERLQAACEAGASSFYSSGIDPGFGNAGITVHSLALCKEVQTVRMMEIVNYATWDNPFTMFEIMGFGKPDTSRSLLLAPGSTALAWGPVIELVAAAIGLGSSTRSPSATRCSLRRSTSRSPRERWLPGPSRVCASRSSEWREARSASWWNTSPGYGTTTPPIGPKATATAST